MQRQKTGHDHWILSLCIEDRQVHTYFLRVTSWSYMSIYLLRVSKPSPTTDITCPAISSTSVPITSCQTHYETGLEGRPTQGSRKSHSKDQICGQLISMYVYRYIYIYISYIYIIYIYHIYIYMYHIYNIYIYNIYHMIHIYISYVNSKIKWLPGNPGLLLRALPEIMFPLQTAISWEKRVASCWLYPQYNPNVCIHLYTLLYIYGREWNITSLKANKIEKIDYRSTARRCVLPGRFKWRLNMFEHAQTPAQGQCFEISQTTNPKTPNPKTPNPKTPNPKT